MAWYYGTYSCGHEGRVNITGPSKDRDGKAEWCFSGLCTECYKKQLEKEKEEKNCEAKKKSTEMDLPELSGTEKQVAWANTLRLSKMELLYECFDKLDKKLKESGLDTVPNKNITMSEISEALEYFVQAHNDSKYWIDCRDRTVTLNDIVNEFQKHVEEEAHRDVLEEIMPEEPPVSCPESGSTKPGVAKSH